MQYVIPTKVATQPHGVNLVGNRTLFLLDTLHSGVNALGRYDKERI